MSKQQNFSQEQTNAYHPPRRRGPGGPMGGRGMMPGEKPKDLKKSLASLLRYMGRYKFGINVRSVAMRTLFYTHIFICLSCSVCRRTITT